MHKIVNYLVALFITGGVAFIAAMILEMKLERDLSEEWSDKYKQVQPYYWWSLLTHDGVEIGGTHGPLKIALHPFVIYTNFPNQSTKHFTINELGFRETGAKQSKVGRKKIVLIGGSTAFGTGLNGDDETIGRFLEEFLGVEVINAAVIGHGSGQELVYLLTELTDLKPDLVVALDGYNDFIRNREVKRDIRLLGTNNSFNQVENQLKIMKHLRDPSFLTRAINSYRVLFPRITDRLSQLRSSVWFGFSGEPELHVEEEYSIAANVYTNNIMKMSRMSTGFHYNFLCVLQPAKDRAERYRSFREIAKAKLVAHGVNHLDLNDMTDLKSEMFMDGVHTDKIGNKLIAERIAETIKKERLL